MYTLKVKHANRIIRVMRLFAIIKAYHHYTMMELYRESLQVENTWKDAEHISDLMNMFMPYTEFSPTDFLHNKNEITDGALEDYEEFKKWTEMAVVADVSERTLTAFCKNMYNLQSFSILNAYGHIFYPDWLMALFLYLNNAISKTELQKTFVEYSMFTGKPKPADIAQFRKVIIEIEELVSQIANKQTNREIKRKTNIPCPNINT